MLMISYVFILTNLNLNYTFIEIHQDLYTPWDAMAYKFIGMILCFPLSELWISSLPAPLSDQLHMAPLD